MTPLNPSYARIWSDELVYQHLFVLLTIALSTLVLALRPNLVLGLGVECGLHALAGINCPFCGMTRDFASILHGHPATLNPSSWFAAAAIYLIYPAAVLWCFMKKRLSFFHAPLTRLLACAAILVMFVLNNIQ